MSCHYISEEIVRRVVISSVPGRINKCHVRSVRSPAEAGREIVIGHIIDHAHGMNPGRTKTLFISYRDEEEVTTAPIERSTRRHHAHALAHNGLRIPHNVR